MTAEAKTVFDFADEMISNAQSQMKRVNEQRGGSFANWVIFSLKRMVLCEEANILWTVVREAAKSSETADGLKDFLIRYRNEILKKILMATNKNSTNAISLEVEAIQEDAAKNFVGSNRYDGNSLAYLLDAVFQYDVDGMKG